MKTLCVGLDVGSSVCALAAIDRESGTLLEEREFDTSVRALAGTFLQLGRKGALEVHVEASTLTPWVRDVVKPLARRFVVSHPKSNAWIGKDPLKNDRVDARKLAELLRMDRCHEVYFSDEPGRQEFKRLVQNYDDATDRQAEMKVTIKDRLRAQGVIVKTRAPFTREGRKAVLALVPCASAREMIGELYEALEALVTLQRSALRLMSRHAERYPEVAKFEKVPGIGRVLACRFSGYIQTPHRFATKRKLWRYCRLGIVKRESNGEAIAREALDRNGCGALKGLSRTAFLGAMKSKEDNAFKRTYLATLARTQDKLHARLTVQRKILATLWALWRRGTEYQDDYAG
jgi:transposase